MFAYTGAAAIPYCAGTMVAGEKAAALEEVISRFAAAHECELGDACIVNFAQVKYAIDWAKPCPKSAARGNSPTSSTFICQNGACTPLGFASPRAAYHEES